MKQKFIRTNDEQTSIILSKIGYQKLTETDGFYTFLNSDTLRFTNDIDVSKIHYSNMLYV